MIVTRGASPTERSILATLFSLVSRGREDTAPSARFIAKQTCFGQGGARGEHADTFIRGDRERTHVARADLHFDGGDRVKHHTSAAAEQIRARKRGAVLLGTWGMSAPAIVLNNSPEKCDAPPEPLNAKVSVPG